MQDTTSFSTSDLYTSAVLLCLDHRITDITAEGKIKTFHFENTEELNRDVFDYVNGKKLGNLRDFRDAIERVKDLIHA